MQKNGGKIVSNKKEIKEEDNQKTWESNKITSVNSTKEIKQGSEEVEKGNGESLTSVDINNLPGKLHLSV